MANLPQVAHATQHIHTIQTGVSTLTAFISSLVSAAVAGGLGWYIRGRGMTGVQIDLKNIKTDIENLKNRVSGAPTPVAV